MFGLDFDQDELELDRTWDQAGKKRRAVEALLHADAEVVSVQGTQAWGDHRMVTVVVMVPC